MELSKDKVEIKELQTKYDALLSDVNPMQKELRYYKSLTSSDLQDMGDRTQESLNCLRESTSLR